MEVIEITKEKLIEQCNREIDEPEYVKEAKEIANKHKDKKSKEEELKQQMYIILFNNCYSSKAINNSYFISSEGIRDSVERMYKLFKENKDKI